MRPLRAQSQKLQPPPSLRTTIRTHAVVGLRICREGATVPALAYFQEILGVPTTIFAFSLGDHIHAPNERFKVGKAWRGAAFARRPAGLGHRRLSTGCDQSGACGTPCTQRVCAPSAYAPLQPAPGSLPALCMHQARTDWWSSRCRLKQPQADPLGLNEAATPA